jgi:hypothetical protein
MIDTAGTIIAATIVVTMLGLVGAAYALLRTADDRSDQTADWLGIGSDSFPHDRSNGR